MLLAPLNDVTRTSNVTVGLTAALLLTTQLPGRFLIIIENTTNGTSIFISEASYVSDTGADRGKRIRAGEEKAFAYGEDIILFAIADNNPASVNVVEAAG